MAKKNVYEALKNSIEAEQALEKYLLQTHYQGQGTNHTYQKQVQVMLQKINMMI